jgi:hypothetical protein
MVRRLACAVAFLTLVIAPTAVADGGGPDPGLMQGWTGVTTAGHPWRYVTLPTGTQTVLAAVRRSGIRSRSERCGRRRGSYSSARGR